MSVSGGVEESDPARFLDPAQMKLTNDADTHGGDSLVFAVNFLNVFRLKVLLTEGAA